MNGSSDPSKPSSTARVLVMLAHPSLHRSRINRRLADAVRHLSNVELHDLYETYPDGDILVAQEQARVAAADVIVALFPFYWYSTPPILKLWQDLVLEHGWAYGSGGTALRGKLFLAALSTGGGESAYQQDGFNRFTIRQLLAPLDQTAYLCGLNFLPPFVVHGTHRLSDGEIASHAEAFAQILCALRDGVLTPAMWHDQTRLNTPGLLDQLAKQVS